MDFELAQVDAVARARGYKTSGMSAVIVLVEAVSLLSPFVPGKFQSVVMRGSASGTDSIRARRHHHQIRIALGGSPIGYAFESEAEPSLHLSLIVVSHQNFFPFRA